MKRLLSTLFLLIVISGVQSQIDTAKIKSLLDTAFIYERSNFDKSLNAANEALSLSTQSNYALGISAAKRQIGLIHYNKGNYDKALVQFIEAIKIAEKNKLYGEVARAYLHMGLVYMDLKENEKAINSFRNGKGICEKNNIPGGLPSFNTNIGIMHNIMQNYDSALFYYNATREAYFSSKNYSGMASIENNIGNVFKGTKKFKEARQHYVKALEYSKIVEDMYVSVNYGNIAEIDGFLGNYASAVTYIDSAVKAAQDFGSKSTEMTLLMKKQKILEEKGDYKGSNECFKKITELKDSLLNEDIQNQIIEVETKYESEKKEAENKLLKQENELKELKIEEDNRKAIFLIVALILSILLLGVAFYAYRTKQQTNKLLTEQNNQINKQNDTLKKLNHQLIESEEALQASNNSKDRLLSVISHDISNPVKALANYTQAGIYNLDKMSIEELRTAFKKINQTAVPLHNMVGNLLNWSRIQKEHLTPVKTSINLNKLIEECCFVYMSIASEKKILIKNAVQSNALIEADKEMMLIIIRNLISNALKFSPEGSSIEITFDENKLLIKDSGKGINDEMKAKILAGINNESNYGTHNEKGIGMGLQLVKDCIDAQHFKWEIDSSENKGTIFKILLSN